MEWGASRRLDGSNALKLGQTDVETYFEFYSQIGKLKHWGKSKLFRLEIVGVPEKVKVKVVSKPIAVIAPQPVQKPIKPPTPTPLPKLKIILPKTPSNDYTTLVIIVCVCMFTIIVVPLLAYCIVRRTNEKLKYNREVLPVSGVTF
jgi:hypothetical protein